MEISEIITIVTLLIGYASALVTIYVNLRVKMKGLELKVIEIEKDLLEFKKYTQNSLEKMDIKIDKFDLKNANEHSKTQLKVDKLHEKLIEFILDKEK